MQCRLKSSINISILCVIGFVLVILSAFMGIVVFNKLPDNFHSSYKLLDYEFLKPVAKSMNKNIVYTLKIYYPLKPGQTNLNVSVKGFSCGVIVRMYVYEYKYHEAHGNLSLSFYRRAPFILLNLEINIPPYCKVLDDSNEVEIFVSVK